MPRLRSRFTNETTEIRRCSCGVDTSWTIRDGVETILHAEPWCEKFRWFVGECQRLEGVRLEAGQVVAPGELEILGRGATEVDVRGIVQQAARARTTDVQVGDSIHAFMARLVKPSS